MYPNNQMPQFSGGPQLYVDNSNNQPMILPSSALHNSSGFDKLMSLSGVYVKQDFQYFEHVTSCDSVNKYVIYPANADGSRDEESIFKTKERSTWFNRSCLQDYCRPFNMKVEHEGSDDGFLVLHKECSFTCCCGNRPLMEVYFTEHRKDPGDYLGKIVNPFKCCNPELQVFNSKNDLKYIIEVDCCQLGFWCQLQCKPCLVVHFEIIDAGRNPTNGKLMKTCEGSINDPDNMSLVFPQNATKEDKALLMSALIMIDFMYFEETPDQKTEANN